jgi:hypothetical protein
LCFFSFLLFFSFLDRFSSLSPLVFKGGKDEVEEGAMADVLLMGIDCIIVAVAEEEEETFVKRSSALRFRFSSST